MLVHTDPPRIRSCPSQPRVCSNLQVDSCALAFVAHTSGFIPCNTFVVKAWADAATAAEGAVVDAEAADTDPTAAQDDFVEKLFDLANDLPTFVVDKQWQGSDACRVTLCTNDDCKAGCDHRSFGTESKSMVSPPVSRDDRPPGCGHGDKGLCIKCEPYNAGGALRCCGICGCTFRTPVKPGGLRLKHVTVADSNGPTGYVKGCYLEKAESKSKKGSEVFVLRSEALEGSARMDEREIKMLMAAAPDEQLSLSTRYQVNATSSLGRTGGGYCSSCVQKNQGMSTGTAREANDESDVYYIPDRDDLIGLVAALGAAKDEEKDTLVKMFHSEVKRAVNVDNAIKDFLTNLVRGCASQQTNKNTLTSR